jgi:hypothetical protein
LDVLPKQPSAMGSAEMFTGDVWLDVIAKGDEPSRIRVNIVRFSPGARTAWHAHAIGQTVHDRGGRADPVPRRRGRRAPPRPDRPHSAGGVALARRRARPLHVPPRHVGGAGARLRTGVGLGDHVTDQEYGRG